MRVLVCGSREWRDTTYLELMLDVVRHVQPITTVVEGCAVGADDLAARWARGRGIRVEHHPAHWRHDDRAYLSLGLHPVPACEYDCKQVPGKAAGVIRNQQMLASGVAMVVAFHPDLQDSKGTADMVRRAKRAGVHVAIFDGGIPS